MFPLDKSLWSKNNMSLTVQRESEIVYSFICLLNRPNDRRHLEHTVVSDRCMFICCCLPIWPPCMCDMIHMSFSPCCCVYCGAWLACTGWGTWILHTECVNSGWTPGCTVSGTLWQPRPNDLARDYTVHREVLYSRTATPHPTPSKSHLSPFPSSPLGSPCTLLHLSSLPCFSTFFSLSFYAVAFHNNSCFSVVISSNRAAVNRTETDSCYLRS